jgi:hypothetical protein
MPARTAAPREGDAPSSSGLPLPNALTDLLLQAAFLGIDTTAKLSKPTLALTKNTLLPQIILPLLREIVEEYAPVRLQAWMKVVPTSLENTQTLFWGTETGRALGERAGRLGAHALEVASSAAARQCLIDATASLIRLLEALHTPEVRAALEQCAVGACRVADVLSSGGAKQLCFDATDAAWALVS